ncbi:hypothetical protein NDU88_004160 [Pleurodeles waltl]|uniref:Secreted protein n=1 Tax=Pleurodeles waltl TaxID=8319 RepID=A0AAV7M6S1_PLEWA|nr:hypothetical protein NDU88_004160 [Pleurodeles waltl]
MWRESLPQAFGAFLASVWLPWSRLPQLSRGAGIDACECSGGARAGSLRHERHTRKPRVPYGAAGKCSSQRSHIPVRGEKGKEWGKKKGAWS